MEQGKALSPAAMQGSQYLSGAALAASKGMMGRYMGYGNTARSLLSHQQRQDNIARAGGVTKAQQSALLQPGGRQVKF
jgi:hypothetical protein